jgi:hypothetical protein
MQEEIEFPVSAKAKIEWQEKMEKMKTLLLNNPFCTNALKKLSMREFEQNYAIALIFYTLPVQSRRKGDSFLKARAKHLRSTAKRLERDADELEKIFPNKACFAEFWPGVTFPGVRPMVPPSEEMQTRTQSLIADIRILAGLLKEEASRFGINSRLSGRAADDYFVIALLRHVYKSTGKFHVETLADLLDYVHRAHQTKRKFSGEQLKKLHQRYLKAVDSSESTDNSSFI